MNTLTKIRKWANASPKRMCITFLIVYTSIALLFRLLSSTNKFLANPIKELAFALATSSLLCYIVWTTRTRKQRGQIIPDVTSVPFYRFWSIIFKTMLVVAICISIGILAMFRIENWGSKPNAQLEMEMKLLGIVFLVPISMLYLGGGWKSTQPGFGSWIGFHFVGALGLFFWNANFSWRHPSTQPDVYYEQIGWWLFNAPFVPFSVALIPWLLWLVMLWPQAQNKNELA